MISDCVSRARDPGSPMKYQPHPHDVDESAKRTGLLSDIIAKKKKNPRKRTSHHKKSTWIWVFFSASAVAGSG